MVQQGTPGSLCGIEHHHRAVNIFLRCKIIRIVRFRGTNVCKCLPCNCTSNKGGLQSQAAATKEVGKVLAKAQHHADAIRESADQLFYLNQELQASSIPVHDVHTARQVLDTGIIGPAATALPNHTCMASLSVELLHDHSIQYWYHVTSVVMHVNQAAH